MAIAPYSPPPFVPSGKGTASQGNGVLGFLADVPILGELFAAVAALLPFSGILSAVWESSLFNPVYDFLIGIVPEFMVPLLALL